MPASYIFKKIIRDEMRKLDKPVKLHVFIDKSQNYEYSMSLLRTYEEHSNGFLTIVELPIKKHPNLVKKYNIERVPTLMFIDNNENDLIRYLAVPQGSEIKPFIQSLQIFAGATNYYEQAIHKNLNNISPSTIKVMITNSCAYCPQMVSIVSQFALASGGKIRAVIIDLIENPDIGELYDTSSVPFTIINDKEGLIGCYGPDEFLEELIGKNMVKT
ncbi:MAG: thioredoxin family protein [Promethearchaeota archaeon]